MNHRALGLLRAGRAGAARIKAGANRRGVARFLRAGVRGAPSPARCRTSGKLLIAYYGCDEPASVPLIVRPTLAPQRPDPHHRSPGSARVRPPARCPRPLDPYCIWMSGPWLPPHLTRWGGVRPRQGRIGFSAGRGAAAPARGAGAPWEASSRIPASRSAWRLHAVRTPQYAAPDRDSCYGLESQPESHRGRSTVAPESAVLAGQIAFPGKSSQPDIAPHKKPGATPRKPAVFRPNRCSSVTPTGRGRSRLNFPSRKGVAAARPAPGYGR